MMTTEVAVVCSVVGDLQFNGARSSDQPGPTEKVVIHMSTLALSPHLLLLLPLKLELFP